MAAGIGSRFGEYTRLIPKGCIKAGGIPMIERSVETLIHCGIERIIIGTGYQKEVYDKYPLDYPQIECCYNPCYAETNSMYTLYQCKEIIGKDDFLLLESDLVFEEKAITSLLECPHPDVMLISPLTKFQDQYFVEHDEQHILSNCSTDASVLHAKGELVGIHKLSNRFYHAMCRDYARKLKEQPKLGYEYELLYMSQHELPIYVLNVEGLKWYEIDDKDDLKYAEEHIIKYI